MSNMFETVIGKIFSGTNFNKMMVVLAVEGVTYLFTKEWPGWTILNAIIFFIVGYCILLFIVWLYKKLKPSEFRSFQKKQDKEWKNNVLSFFYSLPQKTQDDLLVAYTNMTHDKVFYNKRNSSDWEYVSLCRKLREFDFDVPKTGYYAHYYSEPCIMVTENNGVATIVFDPIICKELDKMSTSVAKEDKN